MARFHSPKMYNFITNRPPWRQTLGNTFETDAPRYFYARAVVLSIRSLPTGRLLRRASCSPALVM